MSFPSVDIIEYPSTLLTISREEICRYLGLGQSRPDASLLSLIDDCIQELLSVSRCRACRAIVPVRILDGRTELDTFSIPGKHLARHLKGCNQAILFAATIGMETELQRKRAAAASPARALVLDAAGTAAIEAFCDALCSAWQSEFPGCTLRPRFSPGYGDVPLEVQKPLLSFLDSSRTAGITLTDSLLMLPQKSVSAIVGIGASGCTSQIHNCAQCEKPDCMFRLQEYL